MITPDRIQSLRNNYDMALSPDYLAEVADTIEALWKENAELRAQTLPKPLEDCNELCCHDFYDEDYEPMDIGGDIY